MKIFSRQSLASKLRPIVYSIGGLALIVFSSLMLYEVTKATVVFAQDGEEQTVKTHSSTVGDLLEELGINFSEHDELSYSKDTKIENGMNIAYKQAKKLTLTIDDEEKEYYTTEDTLEKFFEKEELSFSKYDLISHDVETAIEEGLHVSVTTAYKVTIDDGGKEKSVWTTGGTIKQLLEENDIKLKKYDKVKPAIKKEVQKDMLIAITRVEKTKDIVEETVDFKVEQKEDNSLAKGEEKVISEGEKGLVVKEYEITKENGKEVKRELISEEVKKDSKAQVVAIGTKEPEQQVTTVANNNQSSNKTNKTNANQSSNDTNNSSKPASGSGDKEFYVEATAFTSDCNGCSGYTATGINLKANPNMKVIAVDPNVIPLGSKVWVEGYGYAIAGDTGGSIKGNRIDAHVPSKEAAYSFGRKKVKVKVVE